MSAVYLDDNAGIPNADIPMHPRVVEVMRRLLGGRTRTVGTPPGWPREPVQGLGRRRSRHCA